MARRRTCVTEANISSDTKVWSHPILRGGQGRPLKAHALVALTDICEVSSMT